MDTVSPLCGRLSTSAGSVPFPERICDKVHPFRKPLLLRMQNTTKEALFPAHISLSLTIFPEIQLSSGCSSRRSSPATLAGSHVPVRKSAAYGRAQNCSGS